MILNQLFATVILQSLLINIVHILPTNGVTSMKIINLYQQDCLLENGELAMVRKKGLP